MDTQAKSPSERRNETRTFRIVYGLLSLCLVVWPLAAFVVMFIFDAPVESRLDEVLRYSVLAAVWLFPLFFLAGFLLSRQAKQQGRGVPAILRGAIIPLLPIAYVVILWAGALIYDVVNS